MEAVHAQAEMAKLVSFQEYTDSPVWIGGMDVSNSLHDQNKMIYASCVVVSQKNLQVIDHSSVKEKQTFPYIPGLLTWVLGFSLLRYREISAQFAVFSPKSIACDYKWGEKTVKWPKDPVYQREKSKIQVIRF